MSEWVDRPIDDLCEAIVDCVNKTAPSQETPTPFKMLRTTNVRGGWVDTASVRYVDEVTYARWTRRMVPARGDIILTREAPFGDVGMIRTDEQVFLGQRLVMYRVNEMECDRDFLMYSLMGPVVQAELRRLGSGSTVEHLRVPDCKKITIPSPPLAEQRRIGAVLRSIDDLIENNRRRVRVLEEMARAIFWEWFVRFRYPGHEGVCLVDSPLGPIPEGWEVEDVASLSSAVTRGLAPKYSYDGPSTVLNQRCIRDERVSFNSARRQEKPIPPEKLVRRGDVLINSTGVGTLGRVAMYRAGLDDVTVDTHVTIARPRDAGLNPWYGMSLIALQPDLERLGTGSTGQTELRRSDIGNLLMARPTKDLLTSYSAAVWPALDEVDVLLAEAESLERMRALLLPKLVSGQIDVSGLDLDMLVEAGAA